MILIHFFHHSFYVDEGTSLQLIRKVIPHTFLSLEYHDGKIIREIKDDHFKISINKDKEIYHLYYCHKYNPLYQCLCCHQLNKNVSTCGKFSDHPCNKIHDIYPLFFPFITTEENGGIVCFNTHFHDVHNLKDLSQTLIPIILEKIEYFNHFQLPQKIPFIYLREEGNKYHLQPQYLLQRNHNYFLCLSYT